MKIKKAGFDSRLFTFYSQVILFCQFFKQIPENGIAV